MPKKRSPAKTSDSSKPNSKQSAQPATDPNAQSRDPEAQVVEWILAGAGNQDLRQAVATSFTNLDPDKLIVQALKSLESSAGRWRGLAMGFCYEASRELYRRMVEIGDFPGALRAVKQLADLRKAEERLPPDEDEETLALLAEM